MDIKQLVEKYNIKAMPLSLKPNFTKLPVNSLEMTEEGADTFNEFLECLKSVEYINKIIRTPSGGISIARGKLRLPAYDVVVKHTETGRFSGAEITVLCEKMFRLQFSGKPRDAVSGTTAFREFARVFKKFGIDLNDYAVSWEEGKAFKKEIESPLIELDNRAYQDLILDGNVHHLDYNSSYSTGLINLHPEFKAPLTYMYENRHESKDGIQDWYKSVMNSSIGYFQSQYHSFKHAHLSRDAINDNNRRIRELAKKLKKSGRIVISYNTDGIWYCGDIYHDEDEGKNLGQWKNDHVNCKFRAKSNGAYEFIEDGVYHPVVRGTTRLDKKKPRSEWEWGDIYSYDAQPVLFQYIDDKGIKYE